MKKVLFWLLFLPVGLWITFVGITAELLGDLDRWTDRWTHKFENWCMK